MDKYTALSHLGCEFAPKSSSRPFPNTAQVLPLRQQEEQHQDVKNWDDKDRSERGTSLERVKACGLLALATLPHPVGRPVAVDNCTCRANCEGVGSIAPASSLFVADGERKQTHILKRFLFVCFHFCCFASRTRNSTLSYSERRSLRPSSTTRTFSQTHRLSRQLS